MKISSLEVFYTKIERHIKLLAAYMKNERLETIIKMCRLKPYELVYGRKSKWLKTKLYNHWIDEFGNSLKISKNKRLKIIDDPELKDKKVVCTDLYDCLPLDKIGKMSKLLYLLIGKDSNSKDHAIICFTGLDNYFRTYSLNNGEWEQIPPIKLGIRFLDDVVKDLDIRYYKELRNSRQIIVKCKNQKSWISYWPPHRDFLEAIKEYECVSDVLKLKENK